MGACRDTGLGTGLQGGESVGAHKGCALQVNPGNTGEEAWTLCVCVRAKVMCSLHLTYNASNNKITSEGPHPRDSK